MTRRTLILATAIFATARLTYGQSLDDVRKSYDAGAFQQAIDAVGGSQDPRLLFVAAQSQQKLRRAACVRTTGVSACGRSLGRDRPIGRGSAGRKCSWRRTGGRSGGGQRSNDRRSAFAARPRAKRRAEPGGGSGGVPESERSGSVVVVRALLRRDRLLEDQACGSHRVTLPDVPETGATGTGAWRSPIDPSDTEPLKRRMPRTAQAVRHKLSSVERAQQPDVVQAFRPARHVRRNRRCFFLSKLEHLPDREEPARAARPVRGIKRHAGIHSEQDEWRLHAETDPRARRQAAQ